MSMTDIVQQSEAGFEPAATKTFLTVEAGIVAEQPVLVSRPSGEARPWCRLALPITQIFENENPGSPVFIHFQDLFNNIVR